MPHQTFKCLLTSLLVSGSLIGAVAPVGLAQAPAGSTPTTTPPTPTLQERAETLWQTHQLSVMLAGLLLGGYLGVWWLRPLWLLKLPAQDIAVPWTTWKLPLGLVRWLKYRDRVLDTWVKQYRQIVQAKSLKLATVENSNIHLSPFNWTRQAQKTDCARLAPTFNKETTSVNRQSLTWGPD